MPGRPQGRRRGLILIPIFAGVFWVTALIASTLPGLLVLGVNVHGLGASYAGDPGVALAPLSQGILNDVSRDIGQTPVAASPTPRPRASATPDPEVAPTVAAPLPTLAPGPTPVTTSVPQPSATTPPLPSPTPLPSILPTPGPTPAAQGSLSGTVSDSSSGVGIPNATVTLNPGGQAGTTDVSGWFSISAVSQGTYTVTAGATGYQSGSATVTVTAGKKAFVSLKLAGPISNGSVQGTVKDTVAGAGIAAATLTLSPGALTTVTDANGTYSFPNVPAGTYTLTAFAVGYQSQSIQITVTTGQATKAKFNLSPA
jgi:hypothetical protein